MSRSMLALAIAVTLCPGCYEWSRKESLDVPAPKRWAVEILATLEPVARGWFTGSLIWFGDDGSLDSSLLILSPVFVAGRAWIGAGGGVVADSDPDAEWCESNHKARAAARMLGFDTEEARHWVDDYRQTLERECVPIGDAVNANLACVTMLSIHPDEREAIARGAEGANFLGYSLGHYYVFGRHQPGRGNLWEDYEQRRAEEGYDPEAVALAAGNELAHGGTIFLDEIAELPISLQAKLLQIFQDGHFERVGDSRSVQIDCRVIAATNKNLQESIRAGTFREDLFYRLNIVSIHVPPLRERRDDIPMLTKQLTLIQARQMNRPEPVYSARALERLCNYAWAGNVRELKNLVKRLVILRGGPDLGGRHREDP